MSFILFSSCLSGALLSSSHSQAGHHPGHEQCSATGDSGFSGPHTLGCQTSSTCGSLSFLLCKMGGIAAPLGSCGTGSSAGLPFVFEAADFQSSFHCPEQYGRSLFLSQSSEPFASESPFSRGRRGGVLWKLVCLEGWRLAALGLTESAPLEREPQERRRSTVHAHPVCPVSRRHLAQSKYSGALED